MRGFSEYKLIDLLSHIDLAWLEDEIPEKDLEKGGMPHWQEKFFFIKKKKAVISSIAAAGSLALTGAILLMYRHKIGHAA